MHIFSLNTYQVTRCGVRCHYLSERTPIILRRLDYLVSVYAAKLVGLAAHVATKTAIRDTHASCFTDNGINGFKLCVSYALLSQQRCVMSTKEPAVSRFAAWDCCCVNVRRGRDLLCARR